MVCLVKFARERYIFMSYDSEMMIVRYKKAQRVYFQYLRIYLYFNDCMECFLHFKHVICIPLYSASDFTNRDLNALSSSLDHDLNTDHAHNSNCS